ncbi:putative low affinity copper transporter protein [Zalerion maritima]|uniref:Copper transport protein n=1 Tax=Zalerion maritima TaxID=339359 RepID=A0AAD5WSG1_9PEZI|nr:putative low affinity copper transporter protein [Zalerion maritima]
MDDMDMSTTAMAMDMTATGSAVAATATMDMDMSSSSSMDSMMTMMAVFQTNINTSLYSTSWTPNNPATYAATCIFLIILGIVFRAIVAFKAIQEQKWFDKELARRYVIVNGKLPVSEQVSTDSLAKRMTLTENGVEEDVMVVKKKHTHVRPWRFSVDPVRAFIDMILAGVGYLLMLAVMTMNVGYFISVLGGTFLGSLICGRYALVAEH